MSIMFQYYFLCRSLEVFNWTQRMQMLHNMSYMAWWSDCCSFLKPNLIKDTCVQVSSLFRNVGYPWDTFANILLNIVIERNWGAREHLESWEEGAGQLLCTPRLIFDLCSCEVSRNGRSAWGACLSGRSVSSLFFWCGYTKTKCMAGRDKHTLGNPLTLWLGNMGICGVYVSYSYQS